jgi:hypothetical protein
MPLKKALSQSVKNVTSPPKGLKQNLNNTKQRKEKLVPKYVKIMLTALVILCSMYLIYVLYHQDKIKINRYIVAVFLLIFFLMMQSRIN